MGQVVTQFAWIAAGSTCHSRPRPDHGSIPRLALVPVSRSDPGTNRVAGRSKLTRKIVRITSGTNEIHHLAPKLGRIRWVCSGHWQHLWRKLQGVHQSGSIPVQCGDITRDGLRKRTIYRFPDHARAHDGAELLVRIGRAKHPAADAEQVDAGRQLLARSPAHRPNQSSPVRRSRSRAATTSKSVEAGARESAIPPVCAGPRATSGLRSGITDQLCG